MQKWTVKTGMWGKHDPFWVTPSEGPRELATDATRARPRVARRRYHEAEEKRAMRRELTCRAKEPRTRIVVEEVVQARPSRNDRIAGCVVDELGVAPRLR